MESFLQTGTALYLLAAICLAGVMTRWAAGNCYGRLIKESGNLTLTKSKYLRGLKQNAEDTYRMNHAAVFSGRGSGGIWSLLAAKR